jgi:hypothetical protein
MGEFEPGGAGVVEVGEGALFEAGVLGGCGLAGGGAEEGGPRGEAWRSEVFGPLIRKPEFYSPTLWLPPFPSRRR